MVGLGVSEMLILLMMSGGMGFPLGIPPQPEDPMLAKIAPEKCLFYGSWAGVARPQSGSGNSTEELLAEPEIQKSIQAIVGMIRQAAKMGGEEVGDPQVKALMQKAPDWGLALLTNPAAMYVETFDPQKKILKGGIVLNWGDDAKQLMDEIIEFQNKMLPPGAVEKTAKVGNDFYVLKMPGDAPEISWGRWKNYILIGAGEGAIEDILKRTKTPAPAWHDAIAGRLPVERRATVSYVNLKDSIDLAVRLIEAENPGSSEYVKLLGVDRLESLISVTGLDKQGMANRTLLKMQGSGGIFDLFHGESIKTKHLKRIPGDAILAFNVGVDLGKIYDTSIKYAKQFVPRELEQFEQGMAQMEEAMDVSVRRDLLGNLDGIWQLYTSASSGGLFTGWTASIGIKDPAKLKQFHDKLLVMARTQLQNEEGFEIKKTTFAGQTIHFLSVNEPMPVAPAWCISEDQILVGLFPQTIKAHLSRKADNGKTLADNESVKNIMNGQGQVTMLTYQDTREFFRLVYPFIQMVVQTAAGEARNEGIPFDPAELLPSQFVIDKHLKPGVAVVRSAADGVEFHSTQTLPSGSPMAMAPVMVGLTLPAVQSARQAARKAASMNNLRQLGIAMHIHHDTHKAFPAGYSTDKDGKKLLSWRVHLLPYLEQQALYERFKLDEPWDSPHNKKLIQEMPAVYRSPASVAPPGMTVYLGNASERGVLVAPQRKGVKVGRRFRDLTDGMAATLAVVEASDQKAVIWTKPADFAPDAEDPLKGLFRGGSNDFSALFCDGHVERIARTPAAKRLLKAYLTIDGGEPINN